METIDNSRIKSVIGQIIEEECSVGRFSDNCIYLIAGRDSTIAKGALRLMKDLNTKNEAYLNTYELEVVKKVELSNHPKIKERVEKYGDNLLLQLSTPSEYTKKFIVAKTDENRLPGDLELMMYEAERVTASSLKDLLKILAIDNTEEFISLVEDTITEEMSLSSHLAGQQESIMLLPDVCTTRSTSDKNKKLGNISYKQGMEIHDSFADDLTKYRKHRDPETLARLIRVIQDDASKVVDFLCKMQPRRQRQLSDYLDPLRKAKASTMDLEVRYFERIDKSKKNDGRYCLFLKKGDRTEQVHFSSKEGFILYLIYLLDRKKNGDNVDTLKFSDYKDQYADLFGELYSMVYPVGTDGDTGKKKFYNLLKNRYAKGGGKRKGITNAMSLTRNDIGDACEKMLEPPEPFLIPNITSHLTVLPEHIILPPDIIENDFVLKSMQHLKVTH